MKILDKLKNIDYNSRVVDFIGFLLALTILLTPLFMCARLGEDERKKHDEEFERNQKTFHVSTTSSLRYTHSKSLGVCYAVYGNEFRCYKDDCEPVSITSVECTPGVLKVADEIE